MLHNEISTIMICYPEEANGWQNGVYQERKQTMKVLDVHTLEHSTHPGQLLLSSRTWTETESTGFGIYTYVEGPAFSLPTGIRDVCINATVANPTKEDIKVSCYANSILKINAETVPAGTEGISLSFRLCSIEDETILQFFVPTEYTEKEDAPELSLLLCDLSFEVLPFCGKKEKPSLFIASDSTVMSYDRFHYPQAGWGQVLYRYFNKGNETPELMSPDLSYPQNHIYETPNINIENRSIGARSSRSFINEGKWDQLLSRTAEGDYCFIQWGHNDATAVRPNRFVSTADFAWWLKKYIRSCKARKVTPVLVTPISRRNCDSAGVFRPSFGAYADIMLRLGKEEDIPVIDLCRLTVDYLNSIGDEESKLIFLWAAPGAYPDSAYANGVSDNTHLQEYGATMFAGLLAKAILASEHPLLAPLKPFISTDFEVPKPAQSVPPIPADVTSPTGFVMQELHIENKVASFLLNFDDVKDAVKYRVYRKGSVDFQFFPLREVTLEEKQNSPVLPFTIPAADVYLIYVVAVFADGSEGVPSRTIEFRA